MNNHQMHKMLLKQQLSEKYASLIILPNKGATAEEELKWINYIPKHWKPILDKDASDLTRNEISILQHLKEEQEIKPYFENFVSGERTTSISAYKVYEYMSSMDLFTYAYMKLTEEELEYCNNELYKIKEEQEIESKIAELKQSSSMKDSFLVYLFQRKLIKIRNQKSENELRAEIDRNNGIAQKTYSYALGTKRK